jgi:hypothetical protein
MMRAYSTSPLFNRLLTACTPPAHNTSTKSLLSFVESSNWTIAFLINVCPGKMVPCDGGLLSLPPEPIENKRKFPRILSHGFDRGTAGRLKKLMQKPLAIAPMMDRRDT